MQSVIVTVAPATGGLIKVQALVLAATKKMKTFTHPYLMMRNCTVNPQWTQFNYKAVIALLSLRGHRDWSIPSL